MEPPSGAPHRARQATPGVDSARPVPATHECCTLSTVSSFSCSSPGSRASPSSSSDSSKVTQGGMSGRDLRGGQGPHQGTGQQVRCRAGVRRDLPILPQEAVVLGLGLDAGSGCSHLLVNGRHLVLHQAANLQVFLQDLLPTPPTGPRVSQASGLGKAGKLGARLWGGNQRWG